MGTVMKSKELSAPTKYPQVYAQLRAIVGDDWVSVQASDRIAYSYDVWPVGANPRAPRHTTMLAGYGRMAAKAPSKSVQLFHYPTNSKCRWSHFPVVQGSWAVLSRSSRASPWT